MPRITVRFTTTKTEEMTATFSIIGGYTYDLLIDLLNRDLKESFTAAIWEGIEVKDITHIERLDPDDITDENWLSTIQPI